MTKEEIEQEEQRIRIADAGEEYRKQFDNLPAIRFNAFCAGANWALQSENERLKAEMFTLEDIERAFNAGVNSQFEVKALNKTDILDFHARKLHQLVLFINPPEQ